MTTSQGPHRTPYTDRIEYTVLSNKNAIELSKKMTELGAQGFTFVPGSMVYGGEYNGSCVWVLMQRTTTEAT